MGGLLTLPSFVKVFPEMDVTEAGTKGLTQSQKNHRSTIQGISVASYNVGCFCGAITTIWIGDILGRRKTIFLGSFIMVIGAALQCSAFTLGHFIAGRVITGQSGAKLHPHPTISVDSVATLLPVSNDNRSMMLKYHQCLTVHDMTITGQRTIVLSFLRFMLAILHTYV